MKKANRQQIINKTSFKRSINKYGFEEPQEDGQVKIVSFNPAILKKRPSTFVDGLEAENFITVLELVGNRAKSSAGNFDFRIALADCESGIIFSRNRFDALDVFGCLRADNISVSG